MPDRPLDIKGWLIAEAEPDEWRVSSKRKYGGRLFLFRTRTAWTLLSIRHVTTWGEEVPEDGWASVHVDSHATLEALKVALVEAHRSPDWYVLVKAGSQNDADLRALWTPVQIDLDLEESSVHRREFGVRSERRGQSGWQEEALALAVGRLQELGFIVLHSSSSYRDIFRCGLGPAWRRSGNAMIGAAVGAKYGYRVDLVVAIDGTGEIYVRTADGGFEPGRLQRHPPRPLTSGERLKVEQAYRRGSAEFWKGKGVWPELTW